MTELNTGIPAKMQELTRELTSDEIEVVSGGDNKAVNEALGLVVATTAIAVNAMITVVTSPQPQGSSVNRLLDTQISDQINDHADHTY